MNTFTKSILAGAVAMGLSAGAQAGSVASQLFGGFQQLSDNSADQLINAAGAVDTTLDIGDRLRGIFTIETVEQSPLTNHLGAGSGNDELSGVFDIVVTGKAGGPGAFTFTFAASGALNAYAAGAAAVFFEDNVTDYSRVRTNPGDTTATLEAKVTDGNVFWVVGLAALNSWTAFAISDDVGTIGSVPAPGNGGGYNAALNLLVNNSGKTFNKVACILPTGLGMVDMCASGSLLGTGGVDTPYDAFDNVDFTINLVPEPATMSLLGLGFLGLGAMARRRKAA